MTPFDPVPAVLLAGLRRRSQLRHRGPAESVVRPFISTTSRARESIDLCCASIDLYWLPLGAGDALPFVRWNGRIFEAIVARRQGREARDLYHSALVVHLGDDRYIIEMAPVWESKKPDRGVAGKGAVGLPSLGRFRSFRYEVRCWRDGAVPDVASVVERPRRVSTDPDRTRLLIDLVPAFPTATWGRDELAAGEMWNSNSLISWLLARSGHDTDIGMPVNGRAPGWCAGLVVARRQPTNRPTPLGRNPRRRPANAGR